MRRRLLAFWVSVLLGWWLSWAKPWQVTVHELHNHLSRCHHVESTQTPSARPKPMVDAMMSQIDELRLFWFRMNGIEWAKDKESDSMVEDRVLSLLVVRWSSYARFKGEREREREQCGGQPVLLLAREQCVL